MTSLSWSRLSCITTWQRMRLASSLHEVLLAKICPVAWDTGLPLFFRKMWFIDFSNRVYTIVKTTTVLSQSFLQSFSLRTQDKSFHNYITTLFIISTHRFVSIMPTPALFTVFSFLLRIVEGTGTAMYTTVSYAMLTRFYPEKKGTIVVSGYHLVLLHFCTLKGQFSCNKNSYFI